MSRKTHHVVPNPKGGWDVKKGGATKASIHREIKAEAEQVGRERDQPQSAN